MPVIVDQAGRIDALDNAARLQVFSAEWYRRARQVQAEGRPQLAITFQHRAARLAESARYFLLEALEPLPEPIIQTARRYDPELEAAVVSLEDEHAAPAVARAA